MISNLNIRTISDKDFFSYRSHHERIKFLLRYAILAPSTHNIQPWMFKINTNSCELYINSKLSLSEADPTNRYLYITLGCCLENLIVAAKYFRVFDRFKIYEDKSTNLVAEVFLKDLSTTSKVNKNMEKLLQAIKIRMNARGFFKPEKVDAKLLKRLKLLEKEYGVKVGFVDDNKNIKKLALNTAFAIKEIYGKKSFRKELSAWINSNISSKRDGIPGYSLKMPTFLSLIFPHLLRFMNVSKQISLVNFKSFSTAPLVCILSVKEENSINLLSVGRMAERFMLEFYANNYKTSIFVASLEKNNFTSDIQKMFKTKLVPIFLFCAGKMDTQQPFTPRVSLEEKLC